MMKTLAIAAVVLATGCARMFPDKVAMGVARLSVRNAAVLVALLDADTSCGFASTAVKDHPLLDGTSGGPGTATWVVNGCHLRFGDLHEVAKDCNGTATKAGGAVTVSAKRTVKGTLTGSAKNPIVPLDDGSVVFHVEADFEELVVRMDGQNNALTQHSGHLAYDAHPRLAVSASKGVCAIPSNDVLLTGMKYSGAQVTVDDDGSNIDTDVSSSDLSAQIGRGRDKENALWGGITVWGEGEGIPSNDDHDGLDPHYDAGAWQKSWACAADLAQPPSHQCPSLDDAVGQGAARLTVMLFGKFADVVDVNAQCGFASDAALASARNTGTLGDRGGVSVQTISQPCTISFAAPTVVHEECDGMKYSMAGRLKVTGTKTVKGILSGDRTEPAVPTSRDPAEMTLAMEFEDFTVSDSKGRALRVKGGRLDGTIVPRLAKDTTTGACSVKTPVAEFKNLTWTAAPVEVTDDGSTFAVKLDTSSLASVHGPKDGKANWLSGTLSANGTAVHVPAVLDPDYEPAAFDKSYACLPNMKVPASDEDCSLYPELATAAARLVVQTSGAAAQRVNNDSSCGFENLIVKLSPTDVSGKNGEMGYMKWHVNGCEEGASAPKSYATDCNGAVDSVSGSMKVTATRTVTGQRQVILGLLNSITPRAHDAATIALDQVDLSGLAAWRVDGGASAPRGVLTFHQGSLTATVGPITGERKSAPGTFDIPTPIATFTSVSLTNAPATLVSAGKTFNLNLQSASLTAMNGRWQGKGNSLEGTVVLDGHTVALPPMALDPLFDQPIFDASYACTADLLEPVPAR
jgi:hypothetical protein